jgi:hypothetical protein
MKLGSWKLGSLAAVFCLALWAAPAGAQRADDMKPGQGGGGHPCAGDAQRLCGEFIPDRAKIATCLSQKKRELSPACGAIIGGGKSATRHGKGGRHGKRHRRHRR